METIFLIAAYVFFCRKKEFKETTHTRLLEQRLSKPGMGQRIIYSAYAILGAIRSGRGIGGTSPHCGRTWARLKRMRLSWSRKTTASFGLATTISGAYSVTFQPVSTNGMPNISLHNLMTLGPTRTTAPEASVSSTVCQFNSKLPVWLWFLIYSGNYFVLI